VSRKAKVVQQQRSVSLYALLYEVLGPHTLWAGAGRVVVWKAEGISLGWHGATENGPSTMDKSQTPTSYV
jgi:hypothetical protein